MKAEYMLTPYGEKGVTDQTYWFTSGGSASELPQRYAIDEDLAMAAVAQFLVDSATMPIVPGFDWEQD